MRGGWWLLPGSRFAPPLPLPVRLAVLSVAAGIFLWSDPARFRGHEHCPASLRFGVLPFLDQPSAAIRELQRAPVLARSSVTGGSRLCSRVEEAALPERASHRGGMPWEGGRACKGAHKTSPSLLHFPSTLSW